MRPWQARAEPGDRFVSVSPEGLVIFGQVLEGYAEERLQHYRFCRCYSVVCPEGELGDVHVSTIGGFITAEQFDEAREKGWAPDPAWGLPETL